MSEHCTLYSPIFGYQIVVDRLKAISAYPMELVGTADAWKSVSIAGPAGRLTLNSMQRIEPGDEFSRMILGTANHLRKLPISKGVSLHELTDSIFKTELAIGVVAEPGFLEEEGHFDLLFGIAVALDAYIFNGHCFLDSQGNIVVGDDS